MTRLSFPLKFGSSREGSRLFLFLGYFFSILYALMIIIPLIFITLSAFKDNTAIFDFPLGLPERLQFKNFGLAQENVNLLRASGISLFVTVGSEILILILAFPAAFSLARIDTRLSPMIESVFGLGFLIPALAIIMPIYLMTAKAGMINNPSALIIFYPALRLPITILLLASFMRKIPKELEESASIDGASVTQIMSKIFLPLSLPGVVTVVVLNFIDIWNEYLFALILMSSDNRTIQIAVSLLKNQRSIDYGLIAAGVLISLIPVYIVFIFFQERIMQGMLAGSIKE
jgi:multiple sugar transport system permease protein